MKRLLTLLLLATTSTILAQQEFTYQGNPLVRHEFTADPTARVFNDRLYVYTSHDRMGAEYYTMLDWCVFSTDDMQKWQDHGVFFGLDDIPWADDMAWAPDCVERNGKYYFYYPVEREKIGVAVSDNPVGGFVDSGKPLIDKNNGGEKLIGREPIDPTVIVEDGQAYMFFGCRDFRYVKLKDNMVETKGKVKKVDLRGNEGHIENYDGYYGEAPFIFKRNGIFYMVYSNGWGTTSEMVYATATDIEGPFTYQGSILAHTNCTTTHGSMVEYRDQWYLFYHTQDLSNQGFRRSVAFDPISFDDQGNIIPVERSRSSLAAGADYYKGKGRIAISSDGNMHDNDDMQATMMTIMILAKAGLQPQTTLYTYGDHIWASESDDMQRMQVSAQECGERFGFVDTRFIPAEQSTEAAYNAMRDEILKSTASDPLFILAAGPMQVVGEALSRAAAQDLYALTNVTIISHSDWNNNHADNPLKASSPHSDWDEPRHHGWTWEEMVEEFGHRVNFNLISDQNGTGKNPYASHDKFSAGKWEKWEWMTQHADPNVQWIYNNGRKNPCGPDYSDAGLAYYLAADLNGERGDEMGNPAKLKEWLGDEVTSKDIDATRVWEVVLTTRDVLIDSIGATAQLTAQVLPATATNRAISWSTSNDKVATVDATGLVTGVGRGQATITACAADGGKLASANVVVGRVAAGELLVGVDFISIEAEAAINALPENWRVMTPTDAEYANIASRLSPINHTYIVYEGGNVSGGGIAGGEDVLTYKFTPKTSGVYRVTARMGQLLTQKDTTYREDLCNDMFIKMEGDFTPGDKNVTLGNLQNWAKFFGRGANKWGSLSQLDINHKKYNPVYNLKAGTEYTLSISGRSKGLALDYLLLSREPMNIIPHIDLAEVNLEAYQPKIGVRYDRAGFVTFASMDFDKFTNMGNGFTDATVDRFRGVLQMPTRLKWAAAEMTYRGESISGYLVLNTMLESDGESEYIVYINGKKIGSVVNESIFGSKTPDYTVKAHQLTPRHYNLKRGDVIRVEFKSATNGKVPEGNTTATSRGRWHSIEIVK
ncbi:MAG: family 43 glycosylhydrolase [Rikenellaceae bacterium]